MNIIVELTRRFIMNNKLIINMLVPILLVMFILSSSSVLFAEELKAYKGLKFKQSPKEVIDVFRNDFGY